MEVQLEEGEISDDSIEDTTDIDPYIPLKRPKLNFEPPVIKGEPETTLMDEDNENSSHSKSPKLLGSDSESEDDTFGKKLKLSLPHENKKYSIWSKDANEDLTDCLKQVDMIDEHNKLFERSVENYPVPPSFQKNRFVSKFKRKRKQPNIKTKLLDFKYGSVDEIPPSLIASMENNAGNGKRNTTKITRNLEALEVNESSTFEEVADDIANKLKENNVQLILRIVVVLGKKKALQFYEKTRVIEKLGGMLINNGSRKRTSGGVYIFLVRNDKELNESQLNAIFEEEQEEKRCQRAISKQRRRKKATLLFNKEKKGKSSELSNPPPSPDLTELPEKKDLILSMDGCEQSKDNEDTNKLSPEKIELNNQNINED